MADSNDFNGKIIEEFRANGGRVGGPFQGADMLILHHTGVSNPVAKPDATIEVGADTVKVVARVAEPTERDVIWARQKQRSAQLAGYEVTAAPRKIPVVVLDPVK
jgi:hypothetical protein